MTVDEPEKHRDYVKDELDAYRKYSPTQMTQCWVCDNWYPERYCCPACGNDPTVEDEE
jgi:hypothetical protein